MAAEEDTRWDRPTTFSSNTHIKKKRWLLAVGVIALIIGIALIIAGSIMLGIGVSKSKKTCDHVTAVPKYLTVLSDVPYSNALSNYNSASETIRRQLLSTLSIKGSDAPVITILGLSLASDKQRTNAVVGLAYTSQNQMSDETIQKQFETSSNFQLNVLEDASTNTTSNTIPMCLQVNPYNGISTTAKTTMAATTITSIGSSSVSTETSSMSTDSSDSTSNIPSTIPDVTVGSTQASSTDGGSSTTQGVSHSTESSVGSSSTSQILASTTPSEPESSPATENQSTMISDMPTTTSETVTSQAASVSTQPSTESSVGSSSTSQMLASTTPSEPESSSAASLSTQPSTESSVGSSSTSTILASTTPSEPESSPAASLSTQPSTESSVGSSSTSKILASTTPSEPESSPATENQSTMISDMPTTGILPSSPNPVSTVQYSTGNPTPSMYTTTQCVCPSTPTVNPQTVPTSIQTSTYTTPSTTQQTTTVSPTTAANPAFKDLFLLIDDSDAVATLENHESIIDWVVKSLIPSWQIGVNNWEVAPVFYAQNEYNILMDFDENNSTELVTALTTSNFGGTHKPSITRALKVSENTKSRDGVPRTYILISASSEQADIESAQSFAEIIRKEGGTIITLAVGGADGKSLGNLATGSAFSFASPSFVIPPSIAQQINNIIVEDHSTTVSLSTQSISTILPVTTEVPSSSTIDTISSSVPVQSSTTIATSTVVPILSSTLQASTEVPASTVTSVASTKHTTPVPVSCQRSLLILVDQSNAYKDAANFDQMKQWMVHSLVPRLKISPNEILASVYQFSNETFSDTGADYEEQNSDELAKILDSSLTYLETAGPSLTRSLQKASGIYEMNTQTVVLISASDASDDVNSASQFANQLKSKGGAFITVAVGDALSGHLGKLSSGLKYTIVSKSYNIPDQQTEELLQAICSDLPTATTDSPVSSTTMDMTTPEMPTDFSCNPDVAILIDSSSEGQSEKEFNKTVDFIANTLVIDWDVMNSKTEALAMVGSGSEQPIIAPQAYTYNSADALSMAISKLENNYMGGDTSLTRLLTSLKNSLPNRRYQAPLTTIIFTHFTNPEDIASAKKIIDTMTINVIIVGIGKQADPKLLYHLTGNVITFSWTVNSKSVLKRSIQNVVCVSNPATQVATTIQASTIATATPTPIVYSTNLISTDVPSTTTQIVPTCPDCYPDMSNILILLDCSNSQQIETFSQQQQAVITLTSNWNHLNRVAAACYSSKLDQFIYYDNVFKTSDLDALIGTQAIHNSPPNLADSLHEAVGINPVVAYGAQHTILFITKNDPAILDAVKSSQQLISRGSLTAIATGFDDLSNIVKLSSANSAIAWKDTDNIGDVVEAIMNTLPHHNERASTIFSVSSTSISLSSEATVPVSTNTPDIPTTSSKFSTIDPNFYYPPKSSLFIVLDASANGDSHAFNQQKAAAQQLVSNWTHSDRLGLGSYSSNFIETKGYQDLPSVEELVNNIEMMEKSDESSNVKKSLETMNNIVPLPQYGKQTMIIFVSVQDPAALQSSLEAAQNLSRKGGLIMIAVGSKNSANLNQLCSNHQAIVWEDVDKIDNVIRSILLQINEENSVITHSPAVGVSTPGPTEMASTPEVAPESTVGVSTQGPTEMASTPEVAPESTVGVSTQGPTEMASTPEVAPESTVGVSTQGPTEMASTPEVAPESTVGVSTQGPTKMASTPEVAPESTVGVSTPGPTEMASTPEVAPESTVGVSTQGPTEMASTPEVAPESTEKISSEASIAPGTVIPEMSSILLVMDCSNVQTEQQNQQQIQLVQQLIQTWTNFERVCMACFGDGLGEKYCYKTINSRKNAETFINKQTRRNESPNMKRVFNESSLIKNDLEYGIQHTILFTFSKGTDDAQSFAGDLMSKGTTTIIGMALHDVSSLAPLASIDKLITWEDMEDSKLLVSRIMNTLHQ